MEIQINNSYSVCSNYDNIKHIIDTVFNVNYTSFYRAGGRVSSTKLSYSLFNTKSSSFPTGLAHHLKAACEAQNIEVAIKDSRKKPASHTPYEVDFGWELDENQTKAVEIGLARGRGYFHFPTGGGKTAVMIKLAASLGGKSIIIVPSVDLVNQIYQDLTRYIKSEIKIEKIQGASSIPLLGDCDIAVASSSTLNTNFSELKNYTNTFDNLFIDEAHHLSFTPQKSSKGITTPASLNGYTKICLAFNAYYRFGFTATPKENEFFIRAVTGKKLHQVSEDFLISQGRLSKPIIFMLKFEHPWNDNFSKTKLINISDNDTRNEIIVSLANELVNIGKTVLILTDSKKHQIKYFTDKGFPASTGNTSSEERKTLYAGLEDKSIPVLVSTVIREGVNIPSVDVIIRASGNLSETLITQQKGRGMRVTKEKNQFYLIDFWDDDGTKKMFYGGRWKSKSGYLRKHSKARQLLYAQTLSSDLHIVETPKEIIDAIKRQH